MATKTKNTNRPKRRALRRAASLERRAKGADPDTVKGAKVIRMLDNPRSPKAGRNRGIRRVPVPANPKGTKH